MDAPKPDLLDELDVVVERLLVEVDGVGAASSDKTADAAGLSGSSGQAQENRAIHRSRALAARERAISAREPLAEIARRVRDGVEQVRRRRPGTAGMSGPGAPGLRTRQTLVDQLRTAMDAVVDGDLDAVVSSVAGAAATFDGAAHATVCLRDRGGVPRHWAGSDDVGNALAEVQNRVAQGPCIDAARTGRATQVPDLLSTSAPWPTFGAAAVGLGVTGVVAVPLRTRGPVGDDLDAGTGSLTLWTNRANDVTESLVGLAELFARYAGLAVAVARRRARPAKGRHEYGHLAPVLREFAGLSDDDPRRPVLREQLVRGYHPVVEHIALRFRDRGEPLDDLKQAGALGLVNAVNRFDPDNGVDFLGYAVPTITGEIRRHFRDRTWSVHVPRRQKDLYVRLTEAQRQLASELHRAPRVSELAEHLELSRDEVVDALTAQQAHSTQSIDKPAGASDSDSGSGGGAASSLTEWSADLAELDRGLDAVEARETIRPLIAGLPERERLILLLRFFGNQSQTQIADRVGVSQMQISRILSRTLAILRDQIQSDDEPTRDTSTRESTPPS